MRRRVARAVAGVAACLLFALLVEAVVFNFQAVFPGALHPVEASVVQVGGATDDRSAASAAGGADGSVDAGASSDAGATGDEPVVPDASRVLFEAFPGGGGSSGLLDVRTVTVAFDAGAVVDSQSGEAAEASADLSLRDEGNANYYYVGSVPANGSSTVVVHPAGRLTSMLVALPAGASPESVSVTFNAPVPFSFSGVRMLAVFCVALLAWSLRPKSALHRRLWDDRAFLVSLAVALIVAGSVFSLAKYESVYAESPEEQQYQELARAFSEGQLALDAQPSADLLALDNPYDTWARLAQGVDVPLDHAFHDGKFYVYFGALPAVVLFLPYHLLTGGDLPTIAAVLVVEAAFAAGAVFLAASVCRRWCARCSQATFSVLAATLLLGSWVGQAYVYPSMYVLPALSALALAAWGVGLWIRATAGERIAKGRAVAGSSLVALIVLCRPQILAVGLVGAVLVWPFVRGWRSGTGAAFACALAPFAVAFAIAGAYNAARFGSPFDFGATYNLTTNDMTHRGFDLGRIPIALNAYLLQLPTIVPGWPFLKPIDIGASEYLGRTIAEPMFGGILALAPVTALPALLLVRSFRRRLSPGAGALVGACVVGGVLVAAFDGNGAGVLFRYFLDFGFFFALASVLCIVSWTGGRLVEGERENGRTEPRSQAPHWAGALPAVIVATVVLSCALQLLYVAQPGRPF